MTDIQAWIDDSRAQADRAADHVANVAAGVERWTMKVPPTDTDTDTMLIGLLDGTLGQALNALQAVLDRHHKITRYGDDEYSVSEDTYLESPEDHFGFEPFDLCAECVQVEMDLVEEQSEYLMSIGLRSAWPCPTRRSVRDAIGDPQ